MTEPAKTVRVSTWPLVIAAPLSPTLSRQGRGEIEPRLRAALELEDRSQENFLR